MIRADLLITNLSEAATLADGPVPRIGASAGALSCLPQAAVAVQGGRFVWVGSERTARREVRLASRGREVDGGAGTLVPGLVDAHTHVLFTGDRAFEMAWKATGTSYAEIARRGGGILSTVRATRAASPDSLLASAEARLLGMAAAGATAVEVKSGYALTPRGEVALLRLVPELRRRTGLRLVPTFLGAHAIPRKPEGGPMPTWTG